MRGTEPLLADYVLDLMSQLVVVPDPPDQAPLYLVRGLLNMLEVYAWDEGADTRAMLYADMLVVLSALAQASPPGMA